MKHAEYMVMVLHQNGSKKHWEECCTDDMNVMLEFVEMAEELGLIHEVLEYNKNNNSYDYMY